MAEPPSGFAAVLRELRSRAGLTQEELADAAGLSARALSDLERGVAATPRRETARLLGDALGLVGAERERFEAAARGRSLARVPAAAAAAAMRSLPRDVAAFTGRERELEQLAKSALGAGGVVGIHAIGGMAGIGKTAFAVHAAHRLAGRFPGGQIFLPLHGHTPGQAPVAPADALASLLLMIGVPAAQVPAGLEPRAALWRDRVAGRPLLLILDDAAGSEQVRPLLPGGGGSLVLVTSRRHLSALDDATAISLDTLPPGEAAELLVRLAGRAGLSRSDPGVREITGLCGYLPLAVGMMGRQLHRHPAWSAGGRAAELAAARDRLALMETESLSVAAAFDLSYTNLSAGQQRLFRRLGLYPGADIDTYAAAALDGTSLSEARRALEALYDHYLLTEPVQARYRLHDLLREHARALAGRLDPEEDRVAATARLLDYYQHTAGTANGRITRRSRPGPAAAGSSAGPAEVPALTDMQQALEWVRGERASLLACLDYAAATGQHTRVTVLTAGVSGLLLHDGPWADAVTRHTVAVQAAHSLGDQLSEANALGDLANARRRTDDYPAAVQAYERALGQYRDLGDRLGQANVLSDLGDVRMSTDDYPGAERALEEALAAYRDLGDRLGQASVLHNLGELLRLTDDYPGAERALEEALAAYRDLGDRLGQANVFHTLGVVRMMTNDYPGAVAAQERALGIYRDHGAQLGQANALANLGLVWQITGDYPAAGQALENSLGLYRDLGARLGQATALSNLGVVRMMTSDYPGAVRAQEQALGIYRDLGARLGQANALYNLGAVLRLTADYPAAGRALEESLGLARDLGDRSGEMGTLNELGALYRVSGELALAPGCHQKSLEMAREIVSHWDEAQALAGLGRCALADGHAAQAEPLLRQALEIFQRIGAAEAAELRTELDALAAGTATGTAPAAG
jgi:tetratricopeptide (TPR) repeat protein/transcriptional regulator with XRE-family HTH domain